VVTDIDGSNAKALLAATSATATARDFDRSILKDHHHAMSFATIGGRAKMAIAAEPIA